VWSGHILRKTIPQDSFRRGITAKNGFLPAKRKEKARSFFVVQSATGGREKTGILRCVFYKESGIRVNGFMAGEMEKSFIDRGFLVC
jgi:hypothetical protein